MCASVCIFLSLSVCVCNSTKSFECTNFTWPLLYWLSRMIVWEKQRAGAKERERESRSAEMRTCSSQCYSSKTIEFCEDCVLVQSCSNHAHRTPLRNVVKTTPALAAAAVAVATKMSKQNERRKRYAWDNLFICHCHWRFRLVNKYDPLHCIFLRFCLLFRFVFIFTFYPSNKKMSRESSVTIIACKHIHRSYAFLISSAFFIFLFEQWILRNFMT